MAEQLLHAAQDRRPIPADARQRNAGKGAGGRACSGLGAAPSRRPGSAPRAGPSRAPLRPTNSAVSPGLAMARALSQPCPSARRALLPTGTMRALSPLPSTRTVRSREIEIARSRPTSSASRRPEEYSSSMMARSRADEDVAGAESRAGAPSDRHRASAAGVARPLGARTSCAGLPESVDRARTPTALRQILPHQKLEEAADRRQGGAGRCVAPARRRASARRSTRMCWLSSAVQSCRPRRSQNCTSAARSRA